MGDRVPPAKPSDLFHTWLGWDGHHWGAIYRLELRADGNGLLGISADDVRPQARLYEVTHWTVNDGRFDCTLRQIPIGYHGDPLRIRGLALPNDLTLEVGEAADQTRWDPGPRMVREEDFFKDLEQKRNRALELEERMKRY